MKVQFLDGPSLADRLPRLVKTSTKIDIAMAYVKISGLRTLMKNAESLLTRGGSLRIVFGLSTRHGITDKESAGTLLQLSSQSNVLVKKWNHCGFHPKLLIFHGNPAFIVVGSANLTEAAQSTNAEANILVEDPDPQVLRDAEKFFAYYFDSAPTLRRKDVEAYKQRIIQRKETTHAGTTKEDELPSPPPRKNELSEMRPNNIWKISPGKDACYWNDWAQAIDEDEEGIVAIGLNETGSLDNFKSYEALREMVAQKAEEIWNKEWDTTTNVKYATDQLWAFRNNIKKGDTHIIYSESRVFGVAEVTAESKYRYEKAGPISYAHRINVKYKWYKQWPRRADQRIIDTLGKQGTLRLVEEGWLWNYLINKLP